MLLSRLVGVTLPPPVVLLVWVPLVSCNQGEGVREESHASCSLLRNTVTHLKPVVILVRVPLVTYNQEEEVREDSHTSSAGSSLD